MTQDEVLDETLMAHADGELGPEASARLESQLAEDPALVGRLAAFTKTRDALSTMRRHDVVAQAMAPALEAALRTRIEESGKVDGGASQAAVAGKVLPFRQVVSSMPLWAGAAAASLALAVGLGGGLILAGKGQDGLPAMALAAALDRVPSGESEALPDGTVLHPVSSFRSVQGAFCREYKVVHPSAAYALEVSCDAGSGWKTQFMLALAGAKGYAPASAPEMLDLFYTHAAASAPLTAAEERAVLAARRK